MGNAQKSSLKEQKAISEVAPQQVVADLPPASSLDLAGRNNKNLSLLHPTVAPPPRRPIRDGGMSQRVQRARVFTALASLVDERGVGNVSATQVIERAGVSRKSFYELFKDFDDCFQAGLKDGCARMAAEVRAAYSRPASWRARVRAGLWALLSFLDADPLAGRLCVVAALSADPEVLRWRESVLRAAVSAIDSGRDDPEAIGDPPRLAGEGAVGTVLSLLHSRMVTREPVSRLLNELTALVVLPYLGMSAAQRELCSKQPSERPRVVPRTHFPTVGVRLTYRTLRVLQAVDHAPGASNRQIADAADIMDGAQISRLLARLHGLELVENANSGNPSANAWRLTPRGEALAAQSRRWLAG